MIVTPIKFRGEVAESFDATPYRAVIGPSKVEFQATFLPGRTFPTLGAMQDAVIATESRRDQLTP